MRQSGILMPVSSLPSPYGIGALGKAAYEFVDFLADAGQRFWQILPVGPTGYGDSPYQSFSAFAGNPYFVDLDMLCEKGLLLPAEIDKSWGRDDALVEYGLLFEKRFAVLRKAVVRQNKAAPEYVAFCKKNAGWLDDYALFMAIKEANNQVGFVNWPVPLRKREATALKEALAQHAPRFEFWRCVQYFFFAQWDALKQYANHRGIRIIGDTPIYISADSSDLWANPELFQVLPDGRLTAVAGVPPDGFSATGQLWGNPLYNWEYHKRTGYKWWIRRLEHTATLYDINRIDHFRGFSGYYAIPAQDTTAENGEWLPGPGQDFIKAIHKAMPQLEIIAEDLGFLTQEVRELLAYSGYPGMKVLQFAFDTRDENDYLPHNYTQHTIVYTGTHDNTTTEDWQRSANRNDVLFARQYFGITTRQSLTDAFIRAALSSVGNSVVIPLQDWLHLGEEARINTPSTLGGRNWRWRLLPGQLTPKLTQHIRETTALYGRVPLAVKGQIEQVFSDLEECETPAELLKGEREANGFSEAKDAHV